VHLYKRIQPILIRKYDFKGFKQKLSVFFLFWLGISLAVLAVRGGFQRVPINTLDAGAMTSSEEVAIILNTPFTIIKSLEKKNLEEYTFYQPRELKAIYDPIHHYKDAVFKKQNVVVIILESFAKEYTKLGRRSYTPFLDSLMGKSLTCSNAFSNGTKSIEGIPAILCSLPSLHENPFINSIYCFNDQTSLATILGKEGYETAFFHGGINGTMSFDSWSKLAGYHSYFGKDEYNNNDDFDGFWGIWDEPFLQYSVREMSRIKQPFHTTVFTLSSHHPYQIPKKYAGKFPKGDLANSEAIAYADFALRKFFESAKKTNWYSNTLFVVTADHGSLSKAPFWPDVVGNQCLPVLFFKGDNSLTGIHSKVFSQIDILPSVLQLIGYNKSFFSFGESYDSKTPGGDYFYANATHYLFGDSLLYCFNFPKLSVVYNYRSDSTLSTIVTNKYPLLDSLQTIHYKAFMQTYNHTLIHNKGRVK
jgi:phosphoglycerol transferase MdoB-like AlkP superfamily enzyme